MREQAVFIRTLPFGEGLAESSFLEIRYRLELGASVGKGAIFPVLARALQEVGAKLCLMKLPVKTSLLPLLLRGGLLLA